MDMDKSNEVSLAEIQKDIKYIIERLGKIDKSQENAVAEISARLFARDFNQFRMEEYKPLEDRVDSLEKWQIKMVAYSSAIGAVIGGVASVVMPKIMDLF